jgi:hypothetical protein
MRGRTMSGPAADWYKADVVYLGDSLIQGDQVSNGYTEISRASNAGQLIAYLSATAPPVAGPSLPTVPSGVERCGNMTNVGLVHHSKCQTSFGRPKCNCNLDRS